jgi:undecaprenyl phosphate-alpha-L-ara4N flippase subunit ArnE
MRTEPKAFALMIFCTFLTSIAQVLYKFGANRLIDGFSIITLVTNFPLILGLSLYVIAGLILIVALKGGDVTVLYPIVATSYIWVSLLSMFIFKEMMNISKWLGVFVIIAGIISIALGSKKDGITYTEVV